MTHRHIYFAGTLLLDALTKDELYLLSPASLAADNQLSRLVDSSERLEAVRAITGSTHMLTRCKPIVFIEGEPDDGTKATDERIIKLLLPTTAHWALVPSKGKSQVIKAASEMRAAHLHLPGMPVFGLVDDDQGAVQLPDYVIPWPVTMLENLLLDEAALNVIVGPYADAVGLHSPEEIKQSLLDLASEQVEDEKRLRAKERLPRVTLSVDSADLATAETSANSTLATYLTKLRQIDMVTLQNEVATAVQGIVDRGEQLERFHGKNLLRKWYDKYFSSVGIGWNPFLIEVARYAREGQRIDQLAAPAIDRVRLYFPSALCQTLQECPDGSERNRLLASCRSERANWEQGRPTPTGREELRRQVIQYVHESAIDGAHKTSLLQSAMAIGTP